MKRIISLTMSIALGLIIAHPFSASAEDQNANDKKFQKKGGAVLSGKGTAQVTKTTAAPVQIQKNIQSNVAKNTHSGPPGVYAKQGVINHPVTQAKTNVGLSVSQNTQKHVQVNNTVRNQSVVVQQGGGKFTRANNYGGRWTQGNIHGDWNHNEEHVWNNHHYRWYDGGWLIVDGGFWPVPNGPVVYQGGGSLMFGAQQQLANAGYYNGPIDGVAGPGTRQAIAHFQTDNNLPVTGHLNEPTREALGLE